MFPSRLRAVSHGLLLLGGCALTPGSLHADSHWDVSIDGADGARQGVVRQAASADATAGVVVLCDERSPDYRVLIDFPERVLSRQEWEDRWTDVFVLADGDLVHAGRERRSIRAIGRPNSARRMLRFDDAELLLRAFGTADEVAIVAMPASYGEVPPRVTIDSRTFDAALGAACPWAGARVTAAGGAAER